jgi:hypothetical protein
MCVIADDVGIASIPTFGIAQQNRRKPFMLLTGRADPR